MFWLWAEGLDVASIVIFERVGRSRLWIIALFPEWKISIMINNYCVHQNPCRDDEPEDMAFTRDINSSPCRLVAIINVNCKSVINPWR